MSTSSLTLLSKYNAEDWIMFLIPVVAFLSGSNLAGLIPGASGFLVAIVLAALSKTLIGIGQNQSFKSNYEDWLSFIIVFLGALAGGLSANPNYVIGGLVLGYIAKALPSMANGVNAEDVLLTIGAIIAGIGGLLGGTYGPTLVTIGLLMGTIGKALPSIGNGGTVPATVTS